MSEPIPRTTEDGRSQVKGGELEAAAVVKESLAVDECRRGRP